MEKIQLHKLERIRREFSLILILSLSLVISSLPLLEFTGDLWVISSCFHSVPPKGEPRR